MLDELRELKLYTFDVEDARSFPVQGTMLKALKNGFTCIPHALELIARHCLFPETCAFPEPRAQRIPSEAPSSEELASRAQVAKEVLNDWCGFAGEEAATHHVPGLEKCHGWMKRYIKAYSEVVSRRNEKQRLNEWYAHRTRYQRPLFSSQALTASDFNATSLEMCVAQAFRKGPLRRRCMVGNLIPDEVCTTNKRKDDGTFAKLNKANTPTVIMLTGLCLMGLGQDGQVPQTGFVPVNLQELCGWLGRNKEFERNVIESWLYEDEPLFTQSSEQSGVKGWRVSQTWLDDGGWQLIDITHDRHALQRFCADHAGEGFWCYEDAPYEQPDFTLGAYKTLTATPIP